MDDEQMILPTKIFWSPQNMIIDPSDVCNYQCIMCRCQQDKSTQNIIWSFEDYKKAMKNFKPKIVAVGATGEPLLCPDADKIVTDLKQRRCKVILNTNASLLGDNLDWVSSLDLMKVSLDTCEEKLYKFIRGGDLKALTENLREVIERKLCKVRFEYVVMSNNYKQMSEFIEFTSDIGADGAFFRLYEGYDLGDELNEELSNVPFIVEEIKRALDTSTKLGVQSNLKDLYGKQDYVVQRYTATNLIKDNRKNSTCLLPWLQLYIRADGEASPCCGLLELDNVSIGNVFSDENVWNSDKAINLRKDFLKKANYSKYQTCKTCEYIDWKQLLKWAALSPG